MIEKKGGRFIRVGKWGGLYKRVAHKCSDPECAREWAPSPEQCLADDYYCPSCVLHHRNNIERFSEERLKWTADVPNTFYVFSLVDPKRKSNGTNQGRLIKFGRTQHENVLKRYRTSELKQYEMQLLLNLRGKLIQTTKIENWWKQQAQENEWFVRFSDNTFHGQTECIQINDKDLEQMIAKSQEIAATEEKTSLLSQTTNDTASSL